MCMLTDEPARFGDWTALLVCRRWANGAKDCLVCFANLPSVCFYPLRNELNFCEVLTLATKV